MIKIMFDFLWEELEEYFVSMRSKLIILYYRVFRNICDKKCIWGMIKIR